MGAETQAAEEEWGGEMSGCVFCRPNWPNLDVVERAMPVGPTVNVNRLQANIITSIGSAATQTVMHAHIHIVPRAEGDGLKLPWADQFRCVCGWKAPSPAGLAEHSRGCQYAASFYAGELIAE